MWKFIRANYTEDPRTEFLGLLDYDPVKVGALLSKDLPANASSLNGGGGEVEDLANGALAELRQLAVGADHKPVKEGA